MRLLGRDLVDQALASRGLPSDAATLSAQGEALGLAKGQRTADGIYEAVGEGQLSADAVVEAVGAERGAADKPTDDNLLDASAPENGGQAGQARARRARGDGGQADRRHPGTGAARGQRAAVIQLAPCCSPVPGESLVGYFEPGQGIIAHVEACPQALQRVAQRRVHLTWEPGLALPTHVTLEVRTANAVGLLAEMSKAFSQHGVDIKQANCRTSADGGKATNTFHATVASAQQLVKLTIALKEIEGVLGVERVFSPGSGVYPRI